jgi:glucose-1-phosphate thymidylyltransferase
LGCIEEIAYNQGFISKKELEKIALAIKNSEYGKYLLGIIKD